MYKMNINCLFSETTVMVLYSFVFFRVKMRKKVVHLHHIEYK
jgi:hypothetical protein